MRLGDSEHQDESDHRDCGVYDGTGRAGGCLDIACTYAEVPRKAVGRIHQILQRCSCCPPCSMNTWEGDFSVFSVIGWYVLLHAGPSS